MLAQLKADFPGTVRVVYRHFPLLSIHDKAALAVQAAEAAGQQDQFWEMHDLLFQRQNEWAELSVDEFETWLVDQADLAGLDADLFATDLVSARNAQIAQDAWDKGVEIGLPGTPFILINGQLYDGPLDYWNMNAIVQLIMLEDKQFTECPPTVIDPSKNYVATLQTEKGDIVINLYAQAAPLAVNNFVFLAQKGWYDGVTFHRVIPGFIAQAGDPSGTGFGGPGYTFVNEVSPDMSFDRAGLLAMANSGPDTNGSQFFITYGPAEHLNGGYTIFGEVIEGMDVLESLTPRDPSQGSNFSPGDKILHVLIEEK